MNNRRLVTAIEHLAESTEALQQLLRLPRKDIDQMLQLLDNPRAIDSMRHLLMTVRSMQNSVRHSDGTKELASRPSRVDESELRQVLDKLFADKDRFPNLRSMAEFVNKVFHLRVPHQKQSRQRYITNVARKIANSRKAMSYAKRTVLQSPPTNEDESYMQLYHFIRGRLKGE